MGLGLRYSWVVKGGAVLGRVLHVRFCSSVAFNVVGFDHRKWFFWVFILMAFYVDKAWYQGDAPACHEANFQVQVAVIVCGVIGAYN